MSSGIEIANVVVKSGNTTREDNVSVATSHQTSVHLNNSTEKVADGGEFSTNQEIVLSSADEITPHIASLKSQPSSLIRITDKNDVNLAKLFAYVVCGEYLSGAWKEIEFKDFRIHRISGGLTNYLYRCEIDHEVFRQQDKEPSKILLRLYGESNVKNSSMLLKDVVVSAIMSDNQLGPKLYGIFPSGRLEQFINANSMAQNDMYVPELSREIATVMAKFHILEMPFIKEPHWLFDTTAKYLRKASECTFTSDKDIKAYQVLTGYNLDNEYQQLKKVLLSINSPVVFCHNDINVGNILKLNDDKLMVIDYEYGSYNYRGFDLGNHFCEWMMNNNYDKHPYFQYNYELYPSREQQLNFIRAYIQQFKSSMKLQDNSLDNNNNSSSSSCSEETDSSGTTNGGIGSGGGDEAAWSQRIELVYLNEEHLIKEANYFALASHLFWANWSIYQAASCKIKFEYLEYALARCDAYFRQKALLFPNGFEAESNM